MAKQAITDALSVGFQSVSGDLIYALPGQTLKDIKTNVATLLNLGVSHISIYGLQLEEGTNLHKQVELGQLDLPSDDENEAMYDCMLDELKVHGFERYEISNFTNNGSYSYHNLRYWQYKDTWLLVPVPILFIKMYGAIMNRMWCLILIAAPEFIAHCIRSDYQ